MKIQKIIISPHYCSREEYSELISYLNEKEWSYTFIQEKDRKRYYCNKYSAVGTPKCDVQCDLCINLEKNMV